MADPSHNSSENKSDDLALLERLYQETIELEYLIGILVPTIFFIVIAVGIIGNILVILVVCKNHQMQNSTNTLIINLAISDLLFLLLCVPFTAIDYMLPVWIFTKVWCQCLQYLQFVSAYASVWTLVLMASDRFLAVVFPVQSMTLRTVRNTLISVLLLWLVIMVANIPMLFQHDIYQYFFIKEERSSCTFISPTRNGTNSEVKAYYYTFNTFGYAVPLGIVLVLYFFMLRRLWYSMPNTSIRKSEESIRAKKKVTWMVTGVIVTFAICWAPLNVCFLITGYTYQQAGQPYGNTAFVVSQIFGQVLSYSNSCLNPILYAFLSDNFRKAFLRIFGFLLCCRKYKDGQNGMNMLDFERTDARGDCRRRSTLRSSRQFFVTKYDTVEMGESEEQKRLTLTVPNGHTEV